MRVFLIGLPGSGKSSLGKKLAALLDLPFFDLDLLVEEKTGRKIPDIFRLEGEEVFRLREKAALHEVISGHDNLLLACGGGTPCFYDNLPKMQAAGRVVFLNPSFDVILSRLQANGADARPLLAGEALESKLKKLLNDRFPYYTRADIEYAGGDERELAALLLNEG